jgi:replicative superfamily II helicase
VFAVGSGSLCRNVARCLTETSIVHVHAPRAPVTVVDRRADRLGVDGITGIVDEALARGEKTVAIVAPREAAVQIGSAIRERRGSGVAYLHGGLSPRLRAIVTDAFRDGRLDALITTPAFDEEALPPDVRQIVLGAVGPDVERCTAAIGGGLAGHRPVTVTLAAGPDDPERYRRVLDEEAPPREALAGIYRALRDWRGTEPFVWPADETWAYLSAAIPGLARRTIDAACDIFVEAGLASRETIAAAACAVQLRPAAERRDLAASLRHREGRRARAVFEAASAWMLAATPADVERSL